jgi:hypothetical protein
MTSTERKNIKRILIWLTKLEKLTPSNNQIRGDLLNCIQYVSISMILDELSTKDKTILNIIILHHNHYRKHNALSISKMLYNVNEMRERLKFE